jgi:glycolate oxidase iron-sulfur subunit
MTATAGPAAISLPVLDHQKPDAGIDYELFLDCVHCGLCLSSCPTYAELGTEMDSPRGRIYLMRAVTDGRVDLNADVRRHLDLCLDCRSCESACPSGVQYGKLIEPFRVYMNQTQPEATNLSWYQRLILFHVFPYARRSRWSLAFPRFLQWTGLDWLLRKSGIYGLLPRRLRHMQEMLPRLKRHPGRLPELLPAEGKRRARVALFTGCVADGVFPETNVSTARVLQRNGCDVWVPRPQVCCGALHYHAGHDEPAKQFAETNCQAFAATLAAVVDEVDAIIVNAAGCGAMLKDYGHLLHGTPAEETGKRFAAKVRDISEFLAHLGPIPPRHPIPIKATYHDACHLCHAQQIRKEPRQLLGMIPQLELVPLAESELCCGAAGVYNLAQPEMAAQLGERKTANILAAGVQAVFTGNVGCLMQIGRHLRKQQPNIWVAHPIDALWASYSGEAAHCRTEFIPFGNAETE